MDKWLGNVAFQSSISHKYRTGRKGDFNSLLLVTVMKPFNELMGNQVLRK